MNNCPELNFGQLFFLKLRIMKKILFISIAILYALSPFAQENNAAIEKVGFLIVYAGKDYDMAKKVAEEAHEHLGYELNFRGHEYNSELGLSLPKRDCEEEGFEYPAYIQRGRGKDGNFVSVEYTDAYNNFTKGYYIVVVASYTKGSQKINETLKEVKVHYESAYVKYTDIYVGCMH